MSSLPELTKPERSAADDKVSSRQTGTLGKALDVLDAIADAGPATRFTDLLNHLDVPRGTLHRQLTHLMAEGLVTANADHGYELGPRLLQLAARAWSSNSFRLIAEPHLRRLHDQTQETVHLAVLSGSEVVYLDKVESAQTVRMHSQIGNASPVYCTGVGKAMLAALDLSTCERMLETISFQRFTETTLCSTAALRAELTDIRSAGVAFDREEHEVGIHCVAASIAAPNASLVAGVSITAPVFRVPTNQLEDWSDLIRTVAQDISQDAETRLGPRRS